MGQVPALFLDRFKTPIGEMLIVADAEGNLRAIDWTEHEDRTRSFLQLHYGEAGRSLESARNAEREGSCLQTRFHLEGVQLIKSERAWI